MKEKFVVIRTSDYDNLYTKPEVKTFKGLADFLEWVSKAGSPVIIGETASKYGGWELEIYDDYRE